MPWNLFLTSILGRRSIHAWDHWKIPFLWKVLIFDSSDRSKTEKPLNWILLRQKDAPWGGDLFHLNFSKNMWRKIHKLGSPSSRSCIVSSSQGSSDTMLVFQHLSYNYVSICNWENNKYKNQTEETMNTVFFLRETVNVENPVTSSEIESTPK